MRVTSNSIFSDYRKNLNNSQFKINRENLKISSGKKNLDISENTADVINADLFSNKISRNESFINITNTQLDRLKQTDSTLRNISDKIQNVRDYVVDVSKTSTGYNHFAIANTIKGVLEDIVRLSNSDNNGSYLFSGTASRPQDIENTNPGLNNLPFEIIENSPTPTNPSGLEVVFKGNFDDINTKTSEKETQTLNTTADEIFGTNGTEVLNTIIDIYNVIAFDESGNQRPAKTLFNREEISQLNTLQKTLADRNDELNILTAANGSKINRLEESLSYLESENLRLKEYRSVAEDTDIAKAAMELQKEQNILQFALQVGGRINQLNLFQFLR